MRAINCLRATRSLAARALLRTLLALALAHALPLRLASRAAVTTSVDHEELWTEHNAMVASLPEGMLVFDVSLGSALAPEMKQHRRKR